MDSLSTLAKPRSEYFTPEVLREQVGTRYNNLEPDKNWALGQSNQTLTSVFGDITNPTALAGNETGIPGKLLADNVGHQPIVHDYVLEPFFSYSDKLPLHVPVFMWNSVLKPSEIDTHNNQRSGRILSFYQINDYAKKFKDKALPDDAISRITEEDIISKPDETFMNNIDETHIYKRPAIAARFWRPLGPVLSLTSTEFTYYNQPYSVPSTTIAVGYYTQRCKCVWPGEIKTGTDLWFVFTTKPTNGDYVQIIPVATEPGEMYFFDYKIRGREEKIIPLESHYETVVKYFGKVAIAPKTSVSEETINAINLCDFPTSAQPHVEAYHRVSHLPNMEVRLTY